jgi:hypothetical protein
MPARAMHVHHDEGVGNVGGHLCQKQVHHRGIRAR